ncbi:hypothetical protein DM02DRAFT_661836 [Periconia macrospinosa]|uniref:Uncharacterized protein n=1 Tax=Periconia macrospinosa TaxID=97972 RepID=A0A2V1D665_9PLEO|nr:hypothetical protein DM02DRAFT_661836 [Periconia macrospinosa]
MDCLPKFLRVTTHRSSKNNGAAATTTSKQAKSSDKDVTDNQADQRESSRGKSTHPYSHLPVIFDHGVPHPHFARHDNRYWNSVLVEGDVSQYNNTDADEPDENRPSGWYRDIVNRTSQQNKPEYDGKGKGKEKAAVKPTPPHLTTPTAGPSTSQPRNPNKRNPKPPPRTTPFSQVKPKERHLYTLTPIPTPHQSPPPTPTTPSISFTCPSTTTLPTDSPILIYGSPGQRRRVLLPPPTTTTTTNTNTRHLHSPTPLLGISGSDGTIIPVGAGRMRDEVPLPCLSPPSPLAKAYPSCKWNAGRGWDDAVEVDGTWNSRFNELVASGAIEVERVEDGTEGYMWPVSMVDAGFVPNFSWRVDKAGWFEAGVCEEGNVKKDKRNGGKGGGEGGIRGGSGGDEKEEWCVEGGCRVYRPPSVHTVPNTPSCSQVSIPQYKNGQKQGGTHGDNGNAEYGVSGPGESRINELYVFTFPFQTPSRRDSGLSTTANMRDYDNDAVLSCVPQNSALQFDHNASTHSLQTIRGDNGARDLEVVVDAMDEVMTKLTEENKVLWESVAFCDRVLKVVRDRDESIYRGLYDALLKVGLQDDMNSLGQRRGKKGLRRVHLRRKRSSSVESLGSYRGQRHEEASKKAKGKRRHSCLANMSRRTSFASLRSYFSSHHHHHHHQHGGSSPTNQYLFESGSGSQTWVVSDERRSAIDGDDQWRLVESPTPTLTQELASLLGFAQSHMQKLEEDVVEFKKREGYCKDMRDARLT